MTHVAWLADASAIDAWEVSDTHDLVALDTEFVRERTYYAQLGLVQVAAGEAISLIDPLPEGCPAALGRLIVRCPTIVMHSASEDLEALRVACERLPGRMFDTQIAAALAGLGAGLSYQRLIEATLGISLEKSETRTDWLRRPLSERQLAYAADDVRHLCAAAEVIIERLRQAGRLPWAEEDCSRMLAAALAAESNPHPHLSFRPAQRLPAAAQARLRRLLLWRDAEARRSDKPRGWILDNGLALRLAERPPASRAALDHLLDGTPGAPKRLREVLWEELGRPLADDELAIPLARAQENLDRDVLRRLQKVVTDIALQLDIPEGTLAARRQLEALLADREWPAALAGWRRELLEAPLMQALD